MKCRGRVDSLEVDNLSAMFDHEDMVKVGIDLGRRCGQVTVHLRLAAARAYRLGRTVDVEIRPR